jgi:hypothetical protein
LRTKKDRHISPPASSNGGEVLWIKSLIFIFGGNNVCRVTLGCKLVIAVPLIAVFLVALSSVGVVNLDTTELAPVDAPLRLLASEELADTRPGTKRLLGVGCFLGYAS